MYMQGSVCDFRPGHEYMFRITQRFTETVGMQYYDGEGCIRCPEDHAAWDPPCDEPWDGIQCVARAVTDPAIIENYYGAWCMECEFPFTHENFSTAFEDAGYSMPPAPGSILRMSYHINDDDSEVEGFGGQGGQYILRRDCTWWGPVDCNRHGHWSDLQFYPHWMYAGIKDSANMAAAAAVFPDTTNYYCGMESSWYDSLIANGGTWHIGIMPHSRTMNRVSGIVASNSPNPFKPYTVISYRIPDINAPLSIKVYDMQGNLLRELPAKASAFTARWDGRDSRGKLVPSGVYIYKIANGDHLFTSRMVVAR
jgi:hypothetical protein